VTVKTFTDWLNRLPSADGQVIGKATDVSKRGGEEVRRQRNQTDRARAAENRAASPTVALRSALPLLPKARGEIRKLGATSFQGVCQRSKRTKARKAIRKRSGRGTGGE